MKHISTKYPSHIKDMPLDWASMFNNYNKCAKVIDSMNDYYEYCHKHHLTQDVSGVIDSITQYCDLYVTRISRANKILDRPLWKDNLEFFYQRGYKERKKFIDAFFLIVSDLQDKLNNINERYLGNENETTKIGFNK